MSIIFTLNKEVKSYHYSFVKHNLQLLDVLPKSDKGLQLVDHFGAFWSNLWEKEISNLIAQGKQQDVYYFIGPDAGFTDTRVIYLWLQSYKYFYPEINFYLKSLPNALNLENFSPHILESFLLDMQKDQTPELVYSRAHRIG